MLISHRSKGDPCLECGKPSLAHNRQHQPDGDPCSCGAKAAHHQKRRSNHAGVFRPKLPPFYVGIDGEGKGRSPHRYTLLAWSNIDGTERDWVEDENGLTTTQCFELILDMPRRCRAFAYAFNYDLTKILTDVDDMTLYELFRAELRKRPAKTAKLGPYPRMWGDYELNLQGTKFTIAHLPSKRRRVIWDVFKFFQAKFTSALVDWKVATFDELEKMREMKAKRGTAAFMNPDEIREYCLDECTKMGMLAKKLVEAHEEADLPLKTFYGAGSTGGAILKKEGIHKLTRAACREMFHAVASAFFGGRFENSVIGAIEGPLWSYDISSAYPYETTFLPCLDCGTWTHTTNRKDIDNATAAVVKYSLGEAPLGISWAPFPFRMTDGSICYPAESGGGWVWKDEYVQGESMFEHVQFEEAWVYHCDCKHQPFKAIPGYYLVRLKIGKEGKGIVIKLGVNSVYGKLAQSLGDDPPYQSWIWAGMITSGTRAQILYALSLHKDPANMLMVATDGICSREKLDDTKLGKHTSRGPLPKPRETGTGILLPDDKGNMVSKPLGGWEEKKVEKGVFFVRPGIYFPLNPTKEELKTVRARGVGRAVMYNAWKDLVKAWDDKETSIKISDVDRFCGAKSSISRSLKEDYDKDAARLLGLEPTADDYDYTRACGDTSEGEQSYGEWIKRPIQLGFNPQPKRQAWRPDHTLQLRFFPRDLESTPYKKSVQSQEAMLLKALSDEMHEQPDGDYVEYEDFAIYDDV